jgi:hypothetical protein
MPAAGLLAGVAPTCVMGQMNMEGQCSSLGSRSRTSAAVRMLPLLLLLLCSFCAASSNRALPRRSHSCGG